MTSQVGFSNCIDFANDVLKNQRRVKSEQILYYNTKKYKQKDYFNILNDISEHVNLVKLIDFLCNVNHAISVVGYWIFDSNHEKALVLNRESLDIICSPSVGEEQVSKFETVFLLCEIHFINSGTK